MNLVHVDIPGRQATQVSSQSCQVAGENVVGVYLQNKYNLDVLKNALKLKAFS